MCLTRRKVHITPVEDTHPSLTVIYRYTSRCTKDQMSAAAIKFKTLGIDELVKELGLSDLGEHIETFLREMKARKRARENGKYFEHP